MEAEYKDYRESHVKEGKGSVYDNSFNIYSFRNAMWVWEQEILTDVFNRHSKNDTKILDFACGTGRILQFLDSKSKHVTGVDLSSEMLKVARNVLPEMEIIQADITKNNVLKNHPKFDVITAFRFFMNAQESLRKEVFQALFPLLKDDGIFIFNNHTNTLSLSFLFRKVILSTKNLFRSPENRFYNINSLSNRSMEKLINQAGFEVLETYHRGVLPLPNEKTSFDVRKIEKIERWFSSKSFFRLFSVNVMYICKKQKD